MPLKPKNNAWMSLTLCAIVTMLAYIQFDSSHAYASTQEIEASHSVILPLVPPIHLVRQYVQPNSDYSSGHRGIDLAAFDGQSVLAPTSGVIRFVGSVAGRTLITVESADGYRWEVEPVCPVDIAVGTPVNAGDYLGNICFEGQGLTAPSHCQINGCLHVSVRRQTSDAQWRYLSPLAILGALAPSRLKPWDARIGNPA